ncbi:putative Kelch repeat-containing protein 3 [Glarea lozoyensis 74030]|uniref:Putative Kelch repeat-containing protein 3 n=1 Tax=Glarea lozoyensis (strain ATCC 74030 / MF5533) TaxID=1104152 RepID=H0ECW7_GLAL7|nr:putative Kelch repeat-containing protein 3 [Glarea lozoyensis 74030]
MAKDKKKGKSDGKAAAKAEKKAKQEKKSEKKEKVKASKSADSDAEDIDLDAVLAEYAKKQEQFLKVTEVTCEAPKARASSTLIASPANDNELFLFGGEYFNGALATFFNDLYVYMINKDEWRLITSPNSPLPRSGHAWCRGGNAGGIYLFGGEFSSPKQGTFYHYNDFWRLEPSSREWTRIETKGKTPPARSDARSSFTFLPHESGAVLYGGYSRVKATVTGKQMKGGGQAQRNVLKPMVHQDCFYLKIVQPASDAAPNTPPTIRWERRKRAANAPNPARAGATMAYHKGRGIQFGGVHDVEESEEGIDSEFFNTLYTWNIERNRYFPLALRKARANQKKADNVRSGRRGRGQANEDELLRNLAALQTGKSLADADDMDIDRPREEFDEPDLPAKEVLMEFPHPRFNAQLTVQDDVLYIYGGTFEKGDREYTFDEMYAIDLGKLDGVKQIFRREPENWLGSEDGSDDEDDDDEYDTEDDEDEEGDVAMSDAKPLFTESKRKSKQQASTADVSDLASPISSTFDDTPEEVAEGKEADNLPYPRPFESRREFFVRTTNEWQELLMQALRWKGIQPEGLSVKEIKTKAFEMSEERWWDCREEITALEDEQEAAGIGEVVRLEDREGGGAGGGAGRRSSYKTQCAKEKLI